MPAGSAEQRMRIVCAPGSYLEYLPDPQILFPGSSCRSLVSVGLSGDGIAVVSDSFLQHDPNGSGGTFAAYFSEIVIEDADGAVLAIDRLNIDGLAFQSGRAGISGAYAAQGTMIVAGLDLPVPAILAALRAVGRDGDAEAAIGASQLPNSAGVLARVLAADGAALRRAMHRAWSAVRSALTGAAPAERRK
jgi:urease accessory protein